MKQRILQILERLKAKGAEGMTSSIGDFRAISEDSFELEINFAKHKTFLRWETTGKDEVLRIELTHFVGRLDLNRADNPTEFLSEMFEQNVPSFRNSGACLGLQPGSPFPLVCLNATHQFITTMSDTDIVEILSIAIFDLKMGLVFTFPPAIITWE